MPLDLDRALREEFSFWDITYQPHRSSQGYRYVLTGRVPRRYIRVSSRVGESLEDVIKRLISMGRAEREGS